MRAAVLLAALVAVGCEAEIGPNTYYCGAERFCPPGLVCDDSSFSCVEDYQARPFTCPQDSETFEPDNSTAEAANFGDAVCGGSLIGNGVGCIEGSDADHIEVPIVQDCMGADPHIEIRLRYPIATMPLVVEVLDSGGQVLGVGEVCTPADNFSGREHLCLRLEPVAGQSYFVRVRAADDAADCGGDCAHNQYLLDIAYPLS